MPDPVLVDLGSPRLFWTTDGNAGADGLAILEPIKGGYYLPIPPQFISWDRNDPQKSQIIHIARVQQRIVRDIKAVWATPEVTATTLNLCVERLQGTEAPGSGDLLCLATDFSVKATANTVIAANVVTTGARNVLAVHDRLCVYFATDGGVMTAPIELANVCVTITMCQEEFDQALTS